MKLVLVLCMLGLSQPLFAATAKGKTTTPKLSAAEVVRRHEKARGGLEAWRKVQTLSLAGKMDAGTGDSVARSMRMVQSSQRSRRKNAVAAPEPEAKQVELPFKLAKARPNKSRLEIEFAGKTAVQVFDGANGWKLRPFLNRTDAEPFTPQEAKSAAESADLDDPLLDAAANGMKVSVEGVEKVEGRKAYKLQLTAKDGAKRRVWVDAKTFLDVKIEGTPRRMDGKMHDVFVYQRDFRPVQGLMMPFVIETVVDGYPKGHRIFVEKVAVNPALDAKTFAKPRA